MKEHKITALGLLLLILILDIFIFGFLCPKLISSQSDLQVIAGALGAVFGGFGNIFSFFTIKKLWLKD